MAERTLAILAKAVGFEAASAKVGGLNREVGKLGKGAAMTGFTRSAKAAETAVGNLKNRVMGLAGSFGPLIGAGGLLGVTAFLSSSIREAADFGLNVQRVAKVTNMATSETSAMVDTLDKWGVTADRQIQMIGKLEKNLGALTVTQKKTDEFQKQYGFSLVDSNGKIADANTLLLRSADYLNSNASATDKATVMSKLWGKSWQDMVPILSKGSAFIRDQEKNAIHLTDTQVSNIAKFNNSSREFSDTLGDLKVKIGAELMPVLTDALKSASTWLDQNQDKIASLFGEAARIAGSAAQGIMAIFSAVKSGWDMVPAPLQDLLIKGFAADRTIKFLFGFSPAQKVLDIGLGALGKQLGGMFGRGATPVNPVFVSDVTKGVGGLGAGAGAAEGAIGAEGAAAASGFLAPGFMAAAVAVAVPLVMGYLPRLFPGEAQLGAGAGSQPALRTPTTGTINSQTVAMMQGLMPSFRDRAAAAGAIAVTPGSRPDLDKNLPTAASVVAGLRESGLLPALEANTAAVNASTQSNKDLFAAARGVRGNAFAGAFLAKEVRSGKKLGEGDVTVAQALVKAQENHLGKIEGAVQDKKDLQSANYELGVLAGLQRTFQSQGDTASAGKIVTAINELKAAVKAAQTNVTVNVGVTARDVSTKVTKWYRTNPKQTATAI